MEYATLGNTGLLVSKLCFGTMTFGDGRGFFEAIGAVGQAGADELVKTSIAGGPTCDRGAAENSRRSPAQVYKGNRNQDHRRGAQSSHPSYDPGDRTFVDGRVMP